MNRKDRRAAGKRPVSDPPTRTGEGTLGGTASDVAQLFALAVRHHQAGQVTDAEALYRQVLSLDRNHFGTLHHLGIMALQRGQAQAAVDVIGRALAVNDRVPECQYNMAFALQGLGRLDDAARHYRQAAALKPDYVDAHTNLGNVLTQLARHRDAVASYERVIALRPSAEAQYNLANTLARIGRLDEAVGHYQRVLALKPDLGGAHNNLANTLVALRRADDALLHFQRALELDPNLVEARVNLGTTLLQLGQLDAAGAQLERALSVNPNFADAHSNLGNVLLAQGRLEEAGERYRRALELKPEIAEAHNNLGIVLAARGDFAEAARRFQWALTRKPDFIDAYNNLARALLSIGRPDEALATLRRALAVAESTTTRQLFVQCVRVLADPPNDHDFHALMMRALSEPWGRASDLAPAAARLIKRDGALAASMARALEAWPRCLEPDMLLGRSGLAAISGNRLLRCLMDSAGIADVELERWLTAVRFALLEIAAATDGSARAAEVGEGEAILDFCCALARQCFLNEQVFAHTDEELAQAQQLRDAVVAALEAGGAIPELRLALVASYFPLHSLPGAARLLDRAWSDAIAGVVAQQVREPLEEQDLRASIPALTDIANEVSRKVRQQYEENPYPRWAKADPPAEPLSFDQYLRRRLPAAVFRNLGRPQIDVLIAGCGTGQHAIETAQRFAGARVLAVDLSLTSLAYAKRKTRALEGVAIEYGQADILALASLARSFDLIESSGVLHHLADPLAGWRALISLLRPGGFMTVGLYSDVARADIVAARAFIAERGYQPTAADIRRCRQALLDQGMRFGNVVASGDFFSTSGCRDLLFHVQEHRLTIPEIAGFLVENGLAFIGFDVDHFTTQRYLTRFPHDQSMTDLACWDVFERENPATFSGMYQFWVQKP
jgi:tetratricopeptide (TPR) repeat protein